MKNINDYKITTFERKLYEPRGEYSKSVVDVMPYLLRFIEKNVLNDKKITWNTRQSILALFSEVKIKEDTIECYASPVFKTIKSIYKYSDLNDEQKRYITHKISVYFSFIREKSKAVILSNKKKSQTKELASYFYNPSFNKDLGVVLNFPSDDCIYVVNNTPVICLIGWKYTDLPDTDKEIYNYIPKDFNSNKLYVEAIDPTESFYNDYHYFTSKDVIFTDPNVDEIKKSLSSDKTIHIGKSVQNLWPVPIDDNEDIEQLDQHSIDTNPQVFLEDQSNRKGYQGPNLERTPNDKKTAPWLIRLLKISLAVFLLAFMLLVLYVCYLDRLDDFFEWVDKTFDNAPYTESLEQSSINSPSPSPSSSPSHSLEDVEQSTSNSQVGDDLNVEEGNNSKVAQEDSFKESAIADGNSQSNELVNNEHEAPSAISNDNSANENAAVHNTITNDSKNTLLEDNVGNTQVPTVQNTQTVPTTQNTQSVPTTHIAPSTDAKNNKSCVIEGDKLVNCHFGDDAKIKEPVEITLDNIDLSFTLNYSNRAKVQIKFDSEPLCSLYARFEYKNGDVILPIDNVVAKENCSMDLSSIKCKSNFTQCTLLLDSEGTIARVHSHGASSHLGSHGIDTRTYKK